MIDNVTMNQASVPGVLSAKWGFGEPASAGHRPNVVVVTVVLDPTVAGSSEGFSLATNRDGTEVHFDGEVKLCTAAGKSTYSITFKKGSLRSWGLKVAPDPTQRLREVWQITARQFTITADGTPVPFSSYTGDRLKIGG